VGCSSFELSAKSECISHRLTLAVVVANGLGDATEVRRALGRDERFIEGGRHLRSSDGHLRVKYMSERWNFFPGILNDARP
jgi:hypothetical protein